MTSGSCDHASLKVTLGGGRRQRNGGLRCFNASLLEDDVFVRKMHSLLVTLCDESKFVVDIIEWWERAKLLIKRRCIVLSRKKRMREEYLETQLRTQITKELQLLEEDKNHSVSSYLGLRESLQKLMEGKCNGAMIRNRARHMLEGERCTAYFLGL